MPLRKSKGNMYPWVTHTHSHLGGMCSHLCSYCYVNHPTGGRPERYCGPVRLIEKEFSVKYVDPNTPEMTIFIEHMNDILAEDVPIEMVRRILSHCHAFPNNTYVFQTKNPARYSEIFSSLPWHSILGTTAETNRATPGVSVAPSPADRLKMLALLPPHIRKFVTIEPVLDFDVEEFAAMIADTNPFFVNLGADSKNHNLPEPSVEKVMALVAELAKYNIELREKHNLQRLKPS